MPECATTLEPVIEDTCLSLEAVHQSVMDLQRFVMETTARSPSFGYLRYYDEAEVPQELLNGDDELARINAAGSTLVEALADPDQAHMALNSLLVLETLRRADPDLGPDISQPGEVFDKNGAEYLDILFSGDDKLAIKAARLICSRASAGDGGQNNLAAYLPQIITAMDRDKGGNKAESERLYSDLGDALANAHSQPYRGGTSKPSHQLFFAFMKSIDCASIYASEVWRESGELNQQHAWARRNINCMLHLEKQEAGLCRKIADTFNTVNFARYHPEMLADMYRSRMEEPGKSYVLAFVARSDNNLVLEQPRAKKELYDKLAKHGIRYEEHECAGEQDMRRVIEGALELHRLHGTKIEDVLFYAHGDPTSIFLSDNYDGQMTSERTGFLGKLSPALSSKARGIFLSCSGAKEQASSLCIVEAAAQALGREAIGSSVDAAFRTKVKTRAGQAKVEVQYSGKKYVILTAPMMFMPGIGAYVIPEVVDRSDLWLVAPLVLLPAMVPYMVPKITDSLSTARVRRTFSPVAESSVIKN